jgi:hypothetical protein
MDLKPLGAVLTFVLTFASGPAEADHDNCHGVDFDIKRPLVVAKVSAPSRVYFVKGADESASCPSDVAGCSEPSYLVPGDLVLTGKTRGAYVCAAFQSPLARKQDWTNGWLPTSALSPVAPAPAPKDSDWIGEWVHPGGSIRISEGNPGMLKISGLQTYPAKLNVHTGVLDAEVKPAQAMIVFADDGSTPFDKADEGQCLVRMQRVDKWLAVEDNEGCGGVMVTFTGLYRRK